MDKIRFQFDAHQSVVDRIGVEGVGQTVVFQGHIVVQDALPGFLKGVAYMLNIHPDRVFIEKFERMPNTNMPVWDGANLIGVMYWDILPRD